MLQEQESFFTDNWKTQSKIKKIKKEKSKSPRPTAASGGGGSAVGRGIMDDVDFVLGGDTDDSEEEEDRRKSYGSRKEDDNDETTVRVGRHVLPRFESLLGEDVGIEELLSVGRKDKNEEEGKDSRRASSRRDASRRGASKTSAEEDGVVVESKMETGGRSSLNDGRKKLPKVKKEKKKKQKKKKPIRPRPPSPEKEVAPVTGAAANAVRMDSNFIDDDWDSD